MATLELRPLGKALGTEALGVDLAKLDDHTFAWIHQAFAQHPVLVFRDQHLGAGDIAAFGRRFGTPRIHSLVGYRHEEYHCQPNRRLCRAATRQSIVERHENLSCF